MSAHENATPRPWYVEGAGNGVTIRGMGEKKLPIAEIWHNGDHPAANAALIVEAVNAYDTLRAENERLARERDEAREQYENKERYWINHANGITERANIAETALAETRERSEEANAERSQLLADIQLLRTEMATAVTDMQDRAEKAEARIFFFEAEARRYASNYPEGSDGRNTFVVFADMIAERSALSEAQP